MMSVPHLRIVTAARQPLRLKLKPKAPVTGYVDGAWWPRSLDLSTELPALLAVLSIRLGRIQRVSYNLTTWDAAPRRLHLDSHRVRLGGFHAQHPHTVDVIGSTGLGLTLLVLPPATSPSTAHEILMMAGRRDNIDGIDKLLTATATADPNPATSELPDAPAVERWETEGGPVYQRA